MKYFLIEHLTQDYELPDDYIYVALTQEAIFMLDQRKIDYITFEDYYTSGGIRGNTDEFLVEQLKWFDEFDMFLKKVYPDANKLNLNLATIYYSYLKDMVDTIVLTCKIITKFFESENPKEIIFINYNYGHDNVDCDSHTLYFANVESTYSRLIEPMCRDNGIQFKRLILDNYSSIDKIDKINLIRRAKKQLTIIYKLFIWTKKSCKILKFLFKSCRPFGDKTIKILYLTNNDYVYQFSKNLKNRYVENYVYDKGIIHYIKFFFYRTKSLQIHDHKLFDSVYIKESYYKDKIDEIYKWLNMKCGLDISNVIDSRIRYFIEIICPNIIYLIPKYLDYYEKEKINFIVTSQIYTIEEHAAIVATALRDNTKTIYVHHGIDVSEAKSRFFQLIRFFDYYFTQTKGEADHESEIRNEFGRKLPEIYSMNCLLKNYQKNNVKEKLNNSKQTVVFVPIICDPWPLRPVERHQGFAMEYVKWHKALIGYFSTRKDYNFIWKGYFLPNQNHDLMSRIITQENYTNIEFRSDKLDRYIKKGDKILCDVGSTAFFSAIFAGLPVLALYRPMDQQLRKNAYEAFDCSLQPYCNIEEGLKLVGDFLDCEASKYIVELEESDTTIMNYNQRILS